jgi:hypothetical protein
MGAIATQLQVEVAAALAVWRVESGGRAHTPGRAIIRLENHLLFRLWGQNNQARYDKHFRHGGHGGQPGEAWQGHEYRESSDGAFAPLHTGKQGDEYRALSLAMQLAGETIALQCISIGGPQILVANHRRVGYSTPREMYDAFQASERAHVLGFFDFCRTTPAPADGELIRYLRDHNWTRFASYYNGRGQVARYGGLIANAYEEARVLLISEREPELAPPLGEGAVVGRDAEYAAESFAANAVEGLES